MSDGAVSVIAAVVVALILGGGWFAERSGYSRGHEDGLLTGRTESGFASGYLDGYETAKRLVAMTSCEGGATP